ncbi:hypothetical protein [Patiriisocius marinus]|uniref:Uncharacterized protein n=1 Tax=Patiriisocius marinus TaxID=1397112 RepID=A0A5J4IRM9_9FLAO|nr:hypothetical protein [Patiriisocius marinus]GER60559.1 hypothetical protein ULMA_26670 [Patiriisocius marinus]
MKDELDNLFESHKGTFDTAKAPVNHLARFMEKLHQKETAVKTNNNWLRPISIAASIVLILCLGTVGFSLVDTENSFASLPPEMIKTETFFKSSINTELQKLKAFNDPELQEIITETLTEIDLLEAQYSDLKEDLSQSGNDNRVIAAMISNFQDRINLLQEVQETLKDITTLKQNNDENIL